MGSHENQLELFDVSHPAAPRARPTIPGRLLLQLRHDQAVLSVMAGLIGVTVVFACGVERGKHLVRSERMWLARQEPQAAPAERTEARSIAPASPSRPAVTAPAPAAPNAAPTPASVPTKIKPKTRIVEVAPEAAAGTGRGRFAVQVVSYKHSRRAQQELQQLQGRGERAFLVIRNGLTVVYVGPFPSKENAREKSTSLKMRYQDCFVRTL